MEADSTGLAKRKRAPKAVGAGCVVLAVGVASPFVLYWLGSALVGPLTGIIGGITGLLAFLILLVTGFRLATAWYCGKCGNPLAGKAVAVCPTCRTTFE